MSMKVIAHRGASRAERENTLAAFERAALMGADWVELDVRRTNDEVLVVHHDPRLRDGRVIVRLSADELPDYVPTLVAAIEACGAMSVNVEIKNDRHEPDYDPTDLVAAEVADLVARRGWQDKILISSFHLATAVRARVLGLRSAYLVDALTIGALDACQEHGLEAIHPETSSVTEPLVAEAHRRGLAVHVWTEDDPDRMRLLRSWGVDGICTNTPDVLVAVLAG
jgi:glycerophosphoryl diester phosphodiesterase